jgi:hypothetical protein
MTRLSRPWLHHRGRRRGRVKAVTVLTPTGITLVPAALTCYSKYWCRNQEWYTKPDSLDTITR